MDETPAKSAKKEVVSSAKAAEKITHDAFKGLNKLFAKLSITSILVAILVVAAFFIGSLRTEVDYLKKGASLGVATAATLPSVPPSASGAPTPTAPAGKVPTLSAQDHIRGDANAPVKLIEYSDLECPFCKTFHPELQQVMQQYGNKVAWVYRHFPLPFHQNAQKEAEAAECVGDQGGNDKFWQFVDTVFQRTTSNGTGFALDKLGPLAAELGLDQAKFQQCLDSGKYTKLVQDEAAGGGAAGVQGTPTTFVVTKDGTAQVIPGALPVDQVKTTIDAALKK